jgi:hypothetical protein
MQNFQNQITTPPVPELPVAGVVYSGSVVNQTNGSLRMFFIKISNTLRALFGTAGAQFIDAPNGLFFSTQTQTLAASNTRYDITFNQTYLSNGVSVVDSSKITCATGGVYNFQFSAQGKSGSSADKQVYVMINRDGTDLGYTSRQSTVTDNSQHLPLTWGFNIDVQAGSYIKLRWAGSSTNLTLEATAATTPHTGIPSAVLAVNYVAPLPVTLPTPP